MSKEELVQVEETIEAVSADENTLICSLTGEQKKATDKEKTLQQIIRTLTSEYNFDTKNMARDYKVIYTDPDTGKNKRMNADLVVFEAGKPNNQENIIRICVVQPSKTKETDGKNGLAYLESLLGAIEDCEFGLWTNGTSLYFLQKIFKPGEFEPSFEELSDFPGEGESLEDLDRPDRVMLRVAAGESLLSTFKRCHDYIYGNQGKIKTAFWELLNLIFCKIYDERRREFCRKTGETYRRRFWVGVKERNTPEGQEAIAKRINELFKEVKESDEYKDVFTGNEQIGLNNRVLAYIAGELSKYSFLEATVDAKGMAYESIVSNTLKQERGQFFTPRNIVKFMVEMMDPSENDIVLDPACGSGGFLVAVLDHVRHKIAQELYPGETGILLKDRHNESDVVERAKKYAEEKIYGIDFDEDLKKAARMNMVMAGDGHGNIYNFNSLEFPRGNEPDVIKFREKDLFGKVDIIFTNPPFGAKIPIDDPDILANYELGYKWAKDSTGRFVKTGAMQKSQPPEILFIERCYQFLRPGGRMAIVLPDGILGNPETEYIRAWILENCKILASIDLPVEAFLPQVGIQASLLFLQKKSDEEKLLDKIMHSEYDIFMAIAEKVGKDRRGNPIYVRDEDGSEIISSKEVEELRKLANGTREIKTVTVFEKEVDDDLPRIALKWKMYINGEVI